MKIFDRIILKIEALDSDKLLQEDNIDIHIAFGIDANFARGMGVCITSIILNNLDKNIAFHVFTDQINQADIEKLKELTQYKNVKIKIYYIDSKVFKTLPTTMAWSQAIYYRFIMGKVLYGIVDKVLYLDADILCIGSLDALPQVEMKENIILAIADHPAGIEEKIKHLSIKNGKYFNSGVMYIDINKWNDEKIAEKSLDLLLKNPEMYQSFDQDVLNVLLDGKTYFISENWNYIYNLGYMNHELPKGINLIHFTGDKPWQRWTEHHFMVKVYEHYIKKSPWCDIPLSEPSHYKEKRRMAKSYAKRGKYIKAFIWYGKYLCARTKTKYSK